MYVPYPTLFTHFPLKKFLFEPSNFDNKTCQYSSTSLTDTIFRGEDVDKYTSFDNGVYYMVRGEQAKY
jgi:hypothetical protein